MPQRSRRDNAAMLKEIKEKAPFRLRDIPQLANLNRFTFESWSAGRLPVPDGAFPPIADALDRKAAELAALAAEIREQYPPATTPPKRRATR